MWWDRACTGVTRAALRRVELEQRLSLAAVFSARFGVGLIFGFQPPLMALVLQRGGASSLEIGAVTSISTLAVMLCGPLYPGAIARLGLRFAILLELQSPRPYCCSCR